MLPAALRAPTRYFTKPLPSFGAYCWRSSVVRTRICWGDSPALCQSALVSTTLANFGASPRRSRWPPLTHKRSTRFPWQTQPRRTQCGVGANDGCVTGANGPRCDPLVGPPAPPSQGIHLRIGGLSRFLLPGGFKIQVQQHQLGCVAWEKYTNI